MTKKQKKRAALESHKLQLHLNALPKRRFMDIAGKIEVPSGDPRYETAPFEDALIFYPAVFSRPQ